MSDQAPPPVPNPTIASAIAPGWYPDPQMAGTQRYWDGHSWTEHRVPVAPTTHTGANGTAIAGFVLGLVGIVSVSVSLVPIVIGLLALIFGGLGLQRSRLMNGRGGAFSIWGIVLGCITIAAGVTRIIFA